MLKNKGFKSEFARFALNTDAKPENFEKWINLLYGNAPTRSKKRRKK